jgi:alpha-N-arabinofuranosidase
MLHHPEFSKRASLLVITCLMATALSACGSGGGNDTSTTAAVDKPLIRPATGGANALSVTIDAQATGTAVNREVLGQNVQWVDKGDGMVDTQGVLKPEMLAMAQGLGPTTLRYPGGLQSDTYHWAKGLGPIALRGTNEHANARTLQATIMGTQEFLELCEATGASPLITVNIATGTAEEAAAWVKQVNVDGLTSSRSGKKLPKVTRWELGNEPYLKPDENHEVWLTPADFGNKARDFLKAMKAVDPSIEVCLPLSNDKRNNMPATPYPGFSRTVLTTPASPATSAPPFKDLSCISLHNSYAPLALDKPYTDDELYWGAMAGGRTVQADFQAMRSLLAELLPGQQLPFAVTEYNSLFTLKDPLNPASTDQLPRAPVGALAVADVMRVLASTPDVLMAHFWSLSGNGFFGAIHPEARARPAYEVLKLYSEALQGQRLAAQVTAPTVNTPSVGGTAAVNGLPVAEALVTRDGKTLRVLLIHKDPSNPAVLQVNLGSSVVTQQRMSLLQSTDVFDRSDKAGTMTRSELVAKPGEPLNLPAHSVALITLTLQ